MARARTTIAVLMFDRTPIFEMAVPIGVFGVARGDHDAPRFTVLPVAGEPGLLATTSGLTLEAPHSLESLEQAAIIIVPTWRDPHERPPEPALRALRTAHEEGALLVGLCTGAFVLAAAGLLTGRTVATHWYHAAELANAYPETTVDVSALYRDDGDIVTSGGTAAGLEACLHVVRRFWGRSCANLIARRMIVPVHPGGQGPYIAPVGFDAATENPVGEAMSYAIEHLAEATDVGRLAQVAGLSRRSFDRRFRRLTGTSPSQWLQRQRIQHAQRLLEQTDQPLDAIAGQLGFTTVVALRTPFQRLVGVSPSEYRRAFRNPTPTVSDVG